MHCNAKEGTQEMHKSELESHYYEITDLYDLAESLVETLEDERVTNKQSQLELVEPLIDQVGDSADVLCEEFIALAEGKRLMKGRSKNKIEGALRRIYAAIDEYKTKVGHQAGEAMDEFRNVADPIVKKIKRQMEAVIAGIMHLVALSLDKIMSKHDVEELKRRQSQIAMMLHAAGQGMAPGQQV